jgi:hypothetical protein
MELCVMVKCIDLMRTQICEDRRPLKLSLFRIIPEIIPDKR